MGEAAGRCEIHLQNDCSQVSNELLTSFQETINNNDKNYVILEPNQKYNESNQEHEETTLLFESDDELINLNESEDKNYE
ncbi:23612_t:CDS:2 [Cetraspora pellucida]|uniref:23612_t:CDS:1 n=1 Tax=Cetraspora pellucida TaxID=1433469 RepID=A0A9N9H0N7_9GLOM|nr:23612_t:CDS:2 [Cetraspora pellucida]